MRAINLLGIIDDSIKKPMKIMESDKKDRTILKNQKDIDNWNAFDGWAILSTSVEPALIEEHVAATSSYDLFKIECYPRVEIQVSRKSRSRSCGTIFTALLNIRTRLYQPVRLAYDSRGSHNASATCNDKQVIARTFHVLPDDFLIVEQQWEVLESSRQTIATLTAKLNAHESSIGELRNSGVQDSTSYGIND